MDIPVERSMLRPFSHVHIHIHFDLYFGFYIFSGHLLLLSSLLARWAAMKSIYFACQFPYINHNVLWLLDVRYTHSLHMIVYSCGYTVYTRYVCGIKRMVGDVRLKTHVPPPHAFCIRCCVRVSFFSPRCCWQSFFDVTSRCIHHIVTLFSSKLVILQALNMYTVHTHT